MTNVVEQALRNAMTPLVTKLQIKQGVLTKTELDEVIQAVVDTFNNQRKGVSTSEFKEWLNNE